MYAENGALVADGNIDIVSQPLSSPAATEQRRQRHRQRTRIYIRKYAVCSFVNEPSLTLFMVLWMRVPVETNIFSIKT